MLVWRDEADFTGAALPKIPAPISKQGEDRVNRVKSPHCTNKRLPRTYEH